MLGAHLACSSRNVSSSRTAFDQRVHVVGALRRSRAAARPGRCPARSGPGRTSPCRANSSVACRAAASASSSEAVTMWTTPLRRPCVSATAEGFHVDVLAGDRAHDVRSGDEHPAAGRHDHQVGERRAVGGAAGGRAEHDRDLRHPAGRADHRLEHQADRVQRVDALGQPRAAGMPQPDDRHPLANRGVDGVDDVPAALGPHRAAHHGGVGAERDHARRRRSCRARRTPRSCRADAAASSEPASNRRASRYSGSRGSSSTSVVASAVIVRPF